MKELDGKTAIISGGAEGIGLGIAQVLGRYGMNIVIADINAEQLEKARQSLEQAGTPVLAVSLDVVAVEQWRKVAEQAMDRFGKVHMLVNNAGVGGAPKPIDTSSEQDWRWVVDVNLMVVNVASMAGFVPLPMASAYSATKAAVVAMSESWHAELQDQNIHVAVLCPGFVKTRINLSQRNRQAQYESDDSLQSGSKLQAKLGQQMQSVLDAGAPPELIGERVVEAIAAKELYIVTHPNFRSALNALSPVRYWPISLNKRSQVWIETEAHACLRTTTIFGIRKTDYVRSTRARYYCLRCNGVYGSSRVRVLEQAVWRWR
jgi:NAD(P)-dependent dehydrogenase (short-subunit alcohol dehydrogenase family)